MGCLICNCEPSVCEEQADEIERLQAELRHSKEMYRLSNEAELALLDKLDKITALNVPNLLRSLVHEDLIDNGGQVKEVADELQAILENDDE